MPDPTRFDTSHVPLAIQTCRIWYRSPLVSDTIAERQKIHLCWKLHHLLSFRYFFENSNFYEVWWNFHFPITWPNLYCTLKSVLLTCSNIKAGVLDWKTEHCKTSIPWQRGCMCSVCTFWLKNGKTFSENELHSLTKHVIIQADGLSIWVHCTLQTKQDFLPLFKILTTGSFTIANKEITFVPPRRFSSILISLLIFFFLTGCKT